MAIGVPGGHQRQNPWCHSLRLDPLSGSFPRLQKCRVSSTRPIKNYGRLDILVNNSGVYEFAPIEAVTEEQFHRMFNINVLGALLTTQAAVKHLGEGGIIVNIGSLVSRITLPNSVVYSGTKGALDAITGVLARELGPRKIRVNSINPGVVETEGTHKAGFIGSDLEKALVAQTPLGRTGQVTDIAPIAVFWHRTILSGSPASNYWRAAASADSRALTLSGPTTTETKSWYRWWTILRSDANRAIDLTWKPYVGRFHPEA